MTTIRDPQHVAVRVLQAFLVVVGAISLFLALVVPYHATDALVYGQWSKMIGANGGFFFDNVGNVPYSRPLFLLPQGELWWVFGAHEWIGRLLSLAFFGLLLWAIFRLAADRSLPPLAPWLAVLLPFAIPDVVVQAFAGQTDVPVAAVLACAGVLLWRRPDNRATMALLVLVGLCAVLAKATALPALCGIGLAHLIGPRTGLWRRVTRGLVPLACGAVGGLVYGVLMARHFDMPLNEFMGGQAKTSTGAVASATGRVGDAVASFTADSQRPDILLRVEWLGPYVRMLVIFALVYAVVRAVGAVHRIAVPIAWVLALLGYLLGPSVLAGGGSFADTGAGAVAGSLLLLVPLAATLWCPPQWIAPRLLMVRLLAWGIPPLLAWALFGILGDTRTLSPAWPPLIVLCSAILAMGVAGLATRRVAAGAAAVLLVIALAVLDFRNYDGLGLQRDGSYNAVSALRHLGPSTWFDADKARSAADPGLGGEVVAARAARPPGGQLLANDGRMIFFFLRDIEVRGGAPADCASLRGKQAVALLTSFMPQADAERVNGLPCLTAVAVSPGSYAAYRVR
jgi:4-amino-4-deoxy-L-arabinose transferase-like glycosyltransferase